VIFSFKEIEGKFNLIANAKKLLPNKILHLILRTILILCSRLNKKLKKKRNLNKTNNKKCHNYIYHFYMAFASQLIPCFKPSPVVAQVI
jgi:hypothetical protein